MYCLIENPNECPGEGFTVLGLSTARGNKEKIGQVGSGNKHGVLTCLRAGLNPVIFIGNDKLEFYSKPSLMGNKSYSAVWAVFKGQHMNLNMSLEFGELDWTSLEMSMREFISNAIDASDGDSSQVVIDVVDSNSLVGKAGYTRVFIPLTQDVQGYINRLREKI